MTKLQKALVDSPIGKQEIDTSGPPLGVVRMDPEKSYSNTGELLQKYINEGDQSAWDMIKSKIDYTYQNLDYALQALDIESGYSHEIQKRLVKGQKLLFKPNTVIVQVIDPQTHGPGPMSGGNTEWPFMAALMRWYHDKLNVSYHQMSLGEAATAMPGMAAYYSMINPEGKEITTEAALEGRSGNFYGGWGFYFVRQYLSETLSPGASDDPMAGYEESTNGTYLTPGQANDKLMVYDLNRLVDDPSKGREVEVPGGINYQTITLHKAIIGGAPDDAADLEAYPGCVLINVPKFKVHAITLFTNIMKNLGIGLYPMQHTSSGGHEWDYSVPPKKIPGMKGGIPHEVYHPDIDINTGLPKRDASGNYIVKKTGGITATMIDIIQAVKNQNIFMMHVVDGIEMINVDHTGSLLAQALPEGMVFAGIDPVAADLLCARYMFSNVPIKDALETGMDDGNGGIFPQKVPIAKIEGPNIVTESGYDCPLTRDICFKNAEAAGLGIRKYYVVGKDQVTDLSLVSVQGHLGSISANRFSDLITQHLYYDCYKIPWDLQKTAFSYLEAVDQLEGSTLKQDFLDAFDETGSGEVTYEEFGHKGTWGALLFSGGEGLSMSGTDRLGYLKNSYNRATMLKNSDPLMNVDGHDLYKDLFIGTAMVAAFTISQMEIEGPDPFLPGLTFGNGKWPSFSLSRFFQMGSSLYGEGFPNAVAYPSLYSAAFFYADHTQNGGRYSGEIRMEPNPDALDRYMADVSSDQDKKLDFTFFVPAGYENLGGNMVPNVAVTDDPAKILTVAFQGGKEVWA